ncbi:MAG: hypothetical protein ABL921_02090 [Pirellula sp.]
MAGNVFAAIVSNNLYITGDSNANSVDVTSRYGTVYISGQHTGGLLGNTTVNGRSEVSIGNFRGNISVRLGSGDDRFQLYRVEDRAFQNINVDMGNGWEEHVNLASAHFTGNVSINSNGSVRNSVSMGHGSVAGDARIDTGSGNDWIVVSSSVGRNLTINTNGNYLTGLDIVNVGPAGGGDVNGRLKIGGRFTLNTGNGNDEVNLDNLDVDALFANLGADNDTFSAYKVAVKRSVAVDGGTGFDRYATRESSGNVFRGLQSFEGPTW